MNPGYKKILVLVVIITSALFISFFLIRRDSLNVIVKKAQVFKRVNGVYIDSINDFLERKKTGDSCAKIFINFYWRKQYVDVICENSNKKFEEKKEAPLFIKSIFHDNDGTSLLVTQDGVLFFTLYHSYGFKKFSLKYFKEPHHLKLNQKYLNKYLVVSQSNLGDNGFNCVIIDGHWILISMNE